MCACCGRYDYCDTHEVYGGSAKRQASILNGYQVPLCRECHQMVTENHQDTIGMQMVWKEKFQLQAEKKWVESGMTKEEARIKWLAEIGKNYIISEG